MKTRRLQYVAFWNECAWVAGVATFNIVAQGRTLKEAVERLERMLECEALFAVRYKKVPFQVEHVGKKPLKQFSDTSGAVAADLSSSDKNKKFVGTLNVSWNPSTSSKVVKKQR